MFVRKHLLEPLMRPLLAASDPSTALPTGTVIADEAAVEECVLALHRVFVAWGDPAPSFVVYLRPVFLALLEMHCQERDYLKLNIGPDWIMIHEFWKFD